MTKGIILRSRMEVKCLHQFDPEANKCFKNQRFVNFLVAMAHVYDGGAAFLLARLVFVVEVVVESVSQ